MEDLAPRSHEGIKETVRKGLIIVNTGDGKGKTSAALGVVFRSLGRGFRVAMVQFIKGKWKTGEDMAAEKFAGQLELFPMGDGFTWDTQNPAQDIASAQAAWKKCEELLGDPKYQLVVFDELNYVLSYKFLEIEPILEALKKKPPMLHVIITGRDAHPKLIEMADLVTEMKMIKHPYRDQGIKAQPGIEF